MFEFEKEIYRKAAEKHGVTEETVKEVWGFTSKFLLDRLRDPLAPDILVTGFFRLKVSLYRIENQILLHLYKLRFVSGQKSSRRRIERIMTYMLIRRRKLQDGARKGSKIAIRHESIEKINNQ